MSTYRIPENEDKLFTKENFDIAGLQDEIRVDELCDRFLKLFYLDLVEDEKLDPEKASALAYGASYFLKEFLIASRRENILTLEPNRVRQFGGNWYIVKNLEPNMEELGTILEGVAAFYRFCRKVGKVRGELTETIRRECEDLPFYLKRIEDFWNLEGDGYLEWEKKCTLKQ